MHSLNRAFFLDFDHTIFNTDGFFHVDVRNSFLRLGIDASGWEQSYADVWPTGCTLEKHAEVIARRSDNPLPRAEMKRILQDSFSDLRRYLFPDVLPFFKEVKKVGSHFYIISFGDDEWQRYKVFASDLGGYLDAMFFTAIEGGKSGLVLERTKNAAQAVVVIHNNPTDLDLIRDLAPDVRTCCINWVPDEARSPVDLLAVLKFLEARSYLEKLPRHQHIPLGISVVTTMLARRAQLYQTNFAGHLSPGSPKVQAMLDSATRMLMSHGSSAYQASRQAYGLVARMLDQQAVILAYIDCFWFLGLGILLMIPCVFLMKKVQPGRPIAVH